MTELQKYRGNCHCGAFVYEVKLPEITSVFECNCSICTKKGYLWVFPSADAEYTVVKDDGLLTEYTFGSKKLIHKFCSNCASPLLGTSLGKPLGQNLAINAHTIQGLNTWELKRTTIDGAALGDPYVLPVHKGAKVSAVIENGKEYSGSCHCGALTVALSNKPLENNPDVRLVECNCSICERNGYIWVYPLNEHVVFYGEESQVGQYKFADMLAKTFCKTCGVNMTNAHLGLSEEQLSKLPAIYRVINENHSKMLPINVRALHGVDLKQLVLEHFDGAGKIKVPAYVNP